MNDACVISGVSFHYPNALKPALDSFSLNIPEGGSMALLGPNGAGKSTLMDILLTWKAPMQGQVSLFGKPLTSYSRKEMGRTVSLVPQDENSNFAFTVLDYVLFGRAPYLGDMAQPRAEDLDIAGDALQQVGLTSFSGRPVTSLSGGEHQLLLLARAIAQRPRFMLLDEPTSALDPANTAKVLQILKKLHMQGMTLFFTTHDPSMAAEAATHVAMLKSGKLLAAGPLEEVMTSALLTSLYDTPMDTLRHNGRMLVFRTEEEGVR